VPRSISASTNAPTIPMFALRNAVASASQYSISALTAGGAATAILANARASISSCTAHQATEYPGAKSFHSSGRVTALFATFS
jgi:hypothetical protein